MFVDQWETQKLAYHFRSDRERKKVKKVFYWGEGWHYLHCLLGSHVHRVGPEYETSYENMPSFFQAAKLSIP